MIGSVSRADGSSRAQTRQIGPFYGSVGLLRDDDKSSQKCGFDPARTGRSTPQTAIVRRQIRGRRTPGRCRGVFGGLPGDRDRCGKTAKGTDEISLQLTFQKLKSIGKPPTSSRTL